jgi:ABC-2 type transport system permease protein
MNSMRIVLYWELAQRKFFILWWTVGISTLIAVTAISYRALGTHTGQLDEAFKGLTDSAGGFFGGSDFFSPAGYLSSQIYYMLLPILLIVMSVVLVNSLVGRDENDGTIELILARPVSRRQLLLAKALAGLVITMIIAGLSFIVTLVSVRIANIPINNLYLLNTHITSFLFSLSFGAIAFCLMSASRITRGLGSPAAIIFSLGSYMISSLSSFVHWLNVPAKFAPYHYYDTVSLLSGKTNRGLLLYLFIVYMVSLTVALWGYSRRDIGS